MASRPALLFARTLVTASALLGFAAHAETECEKNYTSKPAPSGGTIHQSFVGLYGVEDVNAMIGLKQSAQKNKFEPVGEPTIDRNGLITTIVAQNATSKARGFPIVLMVSPKTDSAIVAVEFKKGVDFPNARGNICAFFDSAGLKGQTANASQAHSYQNSQLALPLLAALNGDMTEKEAAEASTVMGMKQAAKDADAEKIRKANDRGAAPEIADTRKVLTPKTAFDPNAVNASMLAEGTATISGFTCGSVSTPGGAQMLTTPDQPVTLFPYSTYLKEAIDLVDSNRNKGNKVKVDIDKRVFDVKLEGKTNSNGDFRFTRIKPGHYIIMTVFHGSVSTDRATPGSSYDPSTNTIYEWTNHEQVDSSATAVLQADVTVKQDGESVEGVVVRPIGNGRIIPVLSSVCKWHHS
jgi:hypothetical protein